ncbi:hypothetical protein C7121_09850 [Paenibacillus glucanolyticus]|uniref:Rho termination factor N-terminal domain-containing protein n=1 Tax=Paenibacillus TaxID=44249 RepID=UPI000D1A72FA|nr:MULTISPECIES: Rho termination factor N-terminal domain-containing protein [Paenibacillus]AVV56409.1 hypothetical protein C7121_09850 [Paenibacillus glucanolyticus]MBX4145961.1 hypothetical protein [Paenibacillus lautus]MPY19853.1 hypothetical protein [Paenibacillus glucanolyticus]
MSNITLKRLNVVKVVDSETKATVLESKGFKRVTDTPVETDPGTGLNLDKPLEDMKLDELKAYAKLKEIELNGLTKKDEILDAIVKEQQLRDGDSGGGAGNVE